jgi:hypothetical protein
VKSVFANGVGKNKNIHFIYYLFIPKLSTRVKTSQSYAIRFSSPSCNSHPLSPTNTTVKPKLKYHAKPFLHLEKENIGEKISNLQGNR